MIDFNLSLSDLVLIKGFSEAFGKNDKEAIKKILFENGMDVTEGYEEVVCTHRNLQGKIVNCLRFEGVERQDEDWLKNPACSWQNKVDACSDPHLRVELAVMSQQGNNTAYVLDKAKKWKEENKEEKE